MKIVRRDVAHVWAHKLQDEARTPGTGNIFCRAGIIYSYGTHFPIARHVEDWHGKPCVLFTTRSYSVTTSGHCSEVRQSLHGLGLPVFHVKHPDNKPSAEMLAEYRQDVQDLLEKASTARSRADSWLAQAASRADEGNRFAKAFGIKAPKITIPADLSKVKAAVQAEQKRLAAEAKAQAEAEQAERSKRLSEWAGAPLQWQPGKAWLRLSSDGKTVETSQHAQVELRFVKRALRAVLPLLKAGQAFQTNGHKIPVGQYQLESVSATGEVKIGCHTFDRAEVERFAATLKS